MSDKILLGFSDPNRKYFEDVKIGDSIYRVNWDIFNLDINEFKVCNIQETANNDVLALQLCEDLSDKTKTVFFKTIYANRDSCRSFKNGLCYYVNSEDLKRDLDEVIESFSEKDMYMIEWRNKLNA